MTLAGSFVFLAGRVCDDHSNEKLAMEVTALSLIRDRTTIPIPRVQAWGLAASDPVGLGPFIAMDFINGASLSDLLRNSNVKRPTRIMREDISDSDDLMIVRGTAPTMSCPRFLPGTVSTWRSSYASWRGRGKNARAQRPKTLESRQVVASAGGHVAA